MQSARERSFFPSLLRGREVGMMLCLAACLAAAPAAIAQSGGDPEGESNVHPAGLQNELTNGLGSWIWDSKTFNNQPCQLWRAFEIPAGAHVTRGLLRLTVDDKFSVLLDGQKLGTGDRNAELYQFDVTSFLTPGEHVLAVHAYNATGQAGVICGLQAELADGQKIDIQSDRTWRIVPVFDHHWERVLRASNSWASATIIAPLNNTIWWTTSNGLKLVVRQLAEDVTDSGWSGFVDGVTAADDVTNGLGSWIWAARTYDSQPCRLWRSFEIPAASEVRTAELKMTVDNDYAIYLDGRQLGRGGDWRELFEYDLTALLAPGKHVLAVDAFNGSAEAGLILGLGIDLADGRRIDVRSDSSWRIVSANKRHWETVTEASPDWPAASVIAPIGTAPWWSRPVNVNWMPSIKPVNVSFWQTGWFQAALSSLLALVTLVSIHLVAQRAMHRKEQWLQERERARIARDIHDDLGSKMTTLVLHGEVALSDLPPGSETHKRLENICDEARRMLSTLDEILWAVNPKRDTFRDFVAHICGYAQEFLGPTGILCLFDMDLDVSGIPLDLPMKRTLVMVVKEALNNVAKHSGATELELAIKNVAGQLVILVSDNGEGFDSAAVKSGRNGLANINDRVRELGGSCAIISRPGEGCRIEIWVPLERARWFAGLSRLRARLKHRINPQKNALSETHQPFSRGHWPADRGRVPVGPARAGESVAGGYRRRPAGSQGELDQTDRFLS
ncbi:MAG TPA: ATP-binding protein [Verrucomicrobiae bacterium]